MLWRPCACQQYNLLTYLMMCVSIVSFTASDITLYSKPIMCILLFTAGISLLVLVLQEQCYQCSKQSGRSLSVFMLPSVCQRSILTRMSTISKYQCYVQSGRSLSVLYNDLMCQQQYPSTKVFLPVKFAGACPLRTPCKYKAWLNTRWQPMIQHLHPD